MHAPPQPGRSANRPWISRTPTTKLVIVAILCGFAAWILIAGIDLLAAAYNGPTLIAVGAANALVGLVVGILVLKLLLASRARHRRLTHQLTTVAEMNNHIRNALERIQLTAHMSHNRQLIDDIDEASSQIQWALRELLPESNPEEEE